MALFVYLVKKSGGEVMELKSMLMMAKAAKRVSGLSTDYLNHLRRKRLDELLACLTEHSHQWLSEEEQVELHNLLDSDQGIDQMNTAVEAAFQTRSSLGLRALAVGYSRLGSQHFSVLGATINTVTDDYLRAFPLLVDLNQSDNDAEISGDKPWRVKLLSERNSPDGFHYSEMAQHAARGITLGHLLPDHTFGRYGGSSEYFFFGISEFSVALRGIFRTAQMLVDIES